VDFDPGAGVFSLALSGTAAAVVQQLDSNGNFVDAKQLAGSGSAQAVGEVLAIDGSDNVFIGGRILNGDVDMDPGAGVSNLNGSAAADGFITKLDSSGAFAWAGELTGGTNISLNGAGFDTDASGNVYASGIFRNTIDLDPGAGTFNVTSNGSTDLFFVSLNSNGVFRFGAGLGGLKLDTSGGLSVDSDGDIVVTGTLHANSGTVDFDPGPGVSNLTVTAPGQDGFLWKLTQAPPALPVNYDFTQAAFETAEGGATNTTNVVMLTRDDATNAEDVDVVLTGNTATAGSDFTAGPVMVSFAAGESSKAVPIELLGDTTVEVNELVALSLTNFSGSGQVGTTQPTSVLTIENDDSATITIGDVSVVEQNIGGTAQLIFDVTLDANVDVGVDVDYQTADGTAEDQTGNNDYTSTSGTLNFAGAAGETHQIVVDVTGDITVELDETMRVILDGLNASQRDVSLVGTATVLGGSPGVFLNSGQNLGSEASTGVALGDLDGDGDLDAYVAAHTPGGSSDRVYLNDGSGVFTQTGQSFGVSASQKVTLGDLDGDNDLDVIVPNFGTQDEVWLNDGAANFTLQQTLFASGSDQRSFKGSVGDVDGDGDLDIYMAMWTQPNRVWLNNGSATFTDSGQLLGNGGSYDSELVDLDGDGDLDAFVGSNGPNKVWLNDGLGTFSDSGQNLGTVNSQNVALGDIDGDGDFDVVTPTRSPAPFANEVWFNDGSAGFTAGATFGSIESIRLALGDVDGDGDLDVVDAARLTGDPHKVWLNDGSGTFTDSGNDFLITGVAGLALGDVDSDGDPDAFFSRFNGFAPNQVWLNQGVPTGAVSGTGTILNDDSATVSIIGESKDEGTGGSTTFTFDVDLSAPVDAAVSMTADTQDGSATAADDFTGVTGATVSFAAGSTTTQTVDVTVGADSKVELNEAFDLVLSALSAGGREVAFAGAGATESATADVENDDSATLSVGDATVVEGDVAGDNRQLVFPVTLDNPIDAKVSVDFSTQDDTAEDENGDADYESTSGTLTINAGDLSGQIVVNVTEDTTVELDETMRVILNNLDAVGRDVTLAGTGTVSAGNPGVFLNSGQNLGSETSTGVEMGDLDGDGDVDAFVAAHQNNSSRVYLNDGTGVFTSTGQSFPLPPASQLGVLGDFDGDADLDVIITNFGQADEVWLNDGSANFTFHQNLFASGSPDQRSLRSDVGDVDGDGDLDVFIVMLNQGDRVWLNNGSGTFADTGQLLGNDPGADVALLDVEGDGDLDAFVATGGGPNKVWLNNGSGTFSDSGQNLGTVTSRHAVVGDIDGDGDLDVVTPTRIPAPYENEVWLNNGTGVFIAGTPFGSSRTHGLALGDVDGDGDLDAVEVVSDNSGAIHKVWLNDGSGTFTDSGNDFTIIRVNDLALADVDGDGDLDAFISRFNFGAPDTVWINQGTGVSGVFATGTIENDDSAEVSITGESKSEGTGGSTTFTFDVDLSAPVDVAVSMTADTASGSDHGNR